MPDRAVLIETTILVDFLRRSVAAADYLDIARTQGNLVCSVVTRAELIIGSRTRAELRAIDQLLARFDSSLRPPNTHPPLRDISLRPPDGQPVEPASLCPPNTG
jgi:hypothetical protein